VATFVEKQQIIRCIESPMETHRIMTPRTFYFGSMFWAIIGIAVLMTTTTIPMILKFAFGTAAALFLFFLFVGKRRYKNRHVSGHLQARSHREDEFV
jgi:membrane protein implicated in regulation of membrane protease activity